MRPTLGEWVTLLIMFMMWLYLGAILLAILAVFLYAVLREILGVLL